MKSKDYREALSDVLDHPSVPDAVAKTIRITTQAATIPTEIFDRQLELIRKALLGAMPANSAVHALGKAALETLAGYSPTKLLEEMARQLNEHAE